MSKLEHTIKIPSSQETQPPPSSSPNAIEGILRTPVISAPSAPVRPEVPGCVLESVLGVGGMGTVYMARQLTLNRRVAIKILKNQYSSDPNFINLMRHEAQISGKLSHPSLVGCHDIIINRNGASIIMEYIPGHLTGRDVVNFLGPMPEKYVLKVLLAIAHGLDYAYQKGYTHRDVKPGNILFAFDDAFKPRNYDELFHNPESRTALCDFGLAAIRNSLRHKMHDEESNNRTISASEKQQVLGTPLYMSPEQATSPDTLDSRSDIYALGSTAYYLLTGKPPFNGKSWSEVLDKKCENDLPSPRKINPHISATMSYIVCKMGARNPERRFRNYAELINLLERQNALNNEHAPWLVWLLYGHHRTLRRILEIILIFLLLSWGGLSLYTRWLEKNGNSFISAGNYLTHWKGGISSWKILSNTRSRLPELMGTADSAPIHLQRPLFSHHDVLLHFKLTGSGPFSIQFFSNRDLSCLLTQISIFRNSRNSYGLKMEYYTDGISRDIPMPLYFPSQRDLNDDISLTISIEPDMLILKNQEKLLGVAHFNPKDIFDGLILTLDSVPTGSEVLIKRLAIMPKR